MTLIYASHFLRGCRKAKTKKSNLGHGRDGRQSGGAPQPATIPDAAGPSKPQVDFLATTLQSNASCRENSRRIWWLVPPLLEAFSPRYQEFDTRDCCCTARGSTPRELATHLVSQKTFVDYGTVLMLATPHQSESLGYSTHYHAKTSAIARHGRCAQEQEKEDLYRRQHCYTTVQQLLVKPSSISLDRCPSPSCVVFESSSVSSNIVRSEHFSIRQLVSSAHPSSILIFN